MANPSVTNHSLWIPCDQERFFGEILISLRPLASCPVTCLSTQLHSKVLQDLIQRLPRGMSWSIHKAFGEHTMRAVTNVSGIGGAGWNLAATQTWTKGLTQTDEMLRRNMGVAGKAIGQQRNSFGAGPRRGQLYILVRNGQRPLARLFGGQSGKADAPDGEGRLADDRRHHGIIQHER